MAKLNKDEQSLLEKLQAKLDSPDKPSITRGLTAHIDLGDPKQVLLAIKHGFLDDDDAGDDDGKNDDGDDGDDTPKRKGFFDG